MEKQGPNEVQMSRKGVRMEWKGLREGAKYGVSLEGYVFDEGTEKVRKKERRHGEVQDVNEEKEKDSFRSSSESLICEALTFKQIQCEDK